MGTNGDRRTNGDRGTNDDRRTNDDRSNNHWNRNNKDHYNTRAVTMSPWLAGCWSHRLLFPPREFDRKFMVSSVLFDKYHFVIRYEANLICEDLGGFLVEPKTEEIQVN